jgi:hypothetical protein
MKSKAFLAICLVRLSLCGPCTATFCRRSPCSSDPHADQASHSFGPAGLSIGMAVTEKVNGVLRRVGPHLRAGPMPGDIRREMEFLIPATRGSWATKQLACPVGGPWPANVVLLTLTQPLPSEPRKETSRGTQCRGPSELANGQRCSLFTGAMPPVAGMRINYGCPGGFQVVGDIDRSGSVWRVFFQGEKSSLSSRWM